MHPVSTPFEVSAASIRLAGYMIERNLRVAQVLGKAALQSNPFMARVDLRKRMTTPEKSSVVSKPTAPKKPAVKKAETAPKKLPEVVFRAAKPAVANSAPKKAKTATSGVAKTEPVKAKTRTSAKSAAKPAAPKVTKPVAAKKTAPVKSAAKPTNQMAKSAIPETVAPKPAAAKAKAPKIDAKKPAPDVAVKAPPSVVAKAATPKKAEPKSTVAVKSQVKPAKHADNSASVAARSQPDVTTAKVDATDVKRPRSPSEPPTMPVRRA